MPTIGRFGAVGCAMVTPFDEDGRLDLDAAVALARWLCTHGNDFLVLAGTTGESPVLSDAEKTDLWRAVGESVTVPIVAGTSTADTAHSVHLTTAAREAGAAGILAVTPYYSRPPQSGLEAHFRALHAAAAGLPVMLYDIPVRTGRKVAPELIVKLAREEIVMGVKDATGDPAGTAALLAEAPDGFEVYSGNDGDTLALLAVGAVGEMLAAFQKGDVDHARSVNSRLIPSHRFQSTEASPNPLPTKAMMRALGHSVGECRLPLGPAPEGLEVAARRLYQALNG
jgi:4-hydroxy-tetrahydrodipicolinate synthase